MIKYFRIGVIALLLWVLCYFVQLPFQRKQHRYNRDDEYITRCMKTLLGRFAEGIREYYYKFHVFPPQTNDLQESLTAGRVSFSKNGEPFPFKAFDDWGTPLKYIVEATTATVSSAGADRVFNTPDDLKEEIVVCQGTNTYWGASENALFH